MINIAIIDDERNVVNQVQKKVEMVVAGDKKISVYTYTEAERLLKDVSYGTRFHIVISDIEMPGMDGLEMGQRLKKIWPNIYLIYNTYHAEYAMKSYKIDAYQYIMKEEMEALLPEILERLIKRVKKEFKNFVIVGDSIEQEKVYYADLLSIQKVKSAKYVEYRTADKRFRKRVTMEEAMDGAENHEFIMVGRGHAVNMHHIKKIHNNVITMDNGETVSVSYTRLAKIREEINRHWGELC